MSDSRCHAHINLTEQHSACVPCLLAHVAALEQKLAADQRWLERAVLAIFAEQTADEQAAETTVRKNGRGFSSAHAEIGSKMARWLLSGNHLSGRWLTIARKIMPHYAGQLARLAVRRSASTTTTTVARVQSKPKQLSLPLATQPAGRCKCCVHFNVNNPHNEFCDTCTLGKGGVDNFEWDEGVVDDMPPTDPWDD